MSGHSKWHNIKIRKQAQDKKKGKVFGKLSREIIVAAKEGGGDANANNRLRIAIEKARAAGLPPGKGKRAVMRVTAGGERARPVCGRRRGPASSRRRGRRGSRGATSPWKPVPRTCSPTTPPTRS